MTIQNCPLCGTEIMVHEDYCPECGTDLCEDHNEEYNY
jgi:endogenous inhibitor of DNA gyrase (YacG/DUF329 family)